VLSQNDANKPTITDAEGQDMTTKTYKHPDLHTAFALNSIREVVDLLDQGVPTNFVPGIVSKLVQASAEVVTWLVLEED
jgi:hypothetical protein